MPIIQQYNIKTAAATVPDVKALRPTEAEGPGKGLEQLGGAISSFGDAVKKRQEQQDVADAHVAMSQAQADLTSDLHDQTQKGTLDVDDFKQKVQDRMDDIEDNVSTNTGSLYFKQASAEMQAHFLTSSAQASAQLAGEKAKNDYMQSLNNSATALIGDPSSYQFALSQQEQGLDALVATKGLPADTAEKLKLHSTNELAKSAITGWIKLNPDDAKQQLNDGKWDQYLGGLEGNGGEVKKQLLGQADEQLRANDVRQKQADKQQNDALTAQQDKTQNDFLSKMLTGNLKPQDVLDSNLDAFGSGSKDTFLRMIEKQNNESKEKKITTDPYVMKDLWNRIHADDEDPRKINGPNELNKYLGQGLNLADLKNLRGEISGKGTIEGDANAQLKKNFTTMAYNAIAKPDPVTKLPDPEGAKLYQMWLSDNIEKTQQALKDGKKPAQLYDPKSPDYLGNNIDQFQRSPQEIIQSIVNSRKQTTITQPAPGEKMIDVIDPNGRPGRIPESKLSTAKARGFKVQGE